MCSRAPALIGVFLAVVVCFFSACTASQSKSSLPPRAAQSVEKTCPASSATPLEAPERPEHLLAKVPVSSAEPQWGDVDAPVTIVEFSDFECPYCIRVQPTLDALKAKYDKGQLRIVVRHNPLPFHLRARPMAEAAAAVFMLAGNEAFFAFRRLCFENLKEEMTIKRLESRAKTVGVEPKALRTWLDSGLPQEKVEADKELAKKLDATGTPSFWINGVTVMGAQSLERFIAVVDEQLAAAKALTENGVPRRLIYPILTNKNVTLATDTPVKEKQKEPGPEEVDRHVWKIPVVPDDPVQGDMDALVTMVQFSDYECPFCKRVEPTVDELRRRYGKDLRVVWKDHPLPFHSRALPAAKLGRAIYHIKGNDAFWNLHDALFSSQPKLEDADFQRMVERFGLNYSYVNEYMQSQRIADKIEDSQQLADDYSARGTPNFFINGRRLSGAQPYEVFQKLIDEELAKARVLVLTGVPRSRLYDKIVSRGEGPVPLEKKHLDVPVASATRGDLGAPVVIQEFSDFQCPFCRRVQSTLTALEEEFKGRIRIVWRHNPQPFHERAPLAAEASEEVFAQKGNVAFWKYHDSLFEAQTEPNGLERENLETLAVKLGLNMVRFKAALNSRTHRAKVEADTVAAKSVELSATPAFLIDDYFVSGAQSLSVFRRLVRQALRDKKKR